MCRQHGCLRPCVKAKINEDGSAKLTLRDYGDTLWAIWCPQCYGTVVEKNCLVHTAHWTECGVCTRYKCKKKNNVHWMDGIWTCQCGGSHGILDTESIICLACKKTYYPVIQSYLFVLILWCLLFV